MHNAQLHSHLFLQDAKKKAKKNEYKDEKEEFSEWAGERDRWDGKQDGEWDGVKIELEADEHEDEQYNGQDSEHEDEQYDGQDDEQYNGQDDKQDYEWFSGQDNKKCNNTTSLFNGIKVLSQYFPISMYL